jgi:hypothetical protein
VVTLIPWDGNSKIGDEGRLRRGDWLSNGAVARSALRLLIAEARMCSLRVADRVYLMVFGLGEQVGANEENY